MNSDDLRVATSPIPPFFVVNIPPFPVVEMNSLPICVAFCLQSPSWLWSKHFAVWEGAGADYSSFRCSHPTADELCGTGRSI
jgi:hypothetical protein